MTTTHVDVLILGAGLSGIGAACHLSRDCPGKSYALIERREDIGGTWNLFQYPGIRSDSDMYSMGYNFKPWTGTKILADGPSILEYIRDAAQEHHVQDKIHFGRKAVKATWSTETATWTIDVEREDGSGNESWTSNFLIVCTGYYNYDAGYTPDFPGVDQFGGQVIHPQHWPEGLDYSGKRVVVIGSGATAVTLVPSMTDKAEHVTMLQRSPTYIMSLPEDDPITKFLARFLPEMLVYRIGRAKNIVMQQIFFRVCKWFPNFMRKVLVGAVRKQLGDDVDISHFTPNYAPWDERLCIVPEADLFKAMREGDASVVTDHIDSFTDKGIRLKSGKALEADIIATATGLDLKLLGGMDVVIDGQKAEVGKTITYKSIMVNEVPNLAYVFGYTNAAWTLKADIACEYACRVINHMDKHDIRIVKPVDGEGCMTDIPAVNLKSGYIMRAVDRIPKQGSKAPWMVLNNYLVDALVLRHAKIDDGNLKFEKGQFVKDGQNSDKASATT